MVNAQCFDEVEIEDYDDCEFSNFNFTMFDYCFQEHLNELSRYYEVDSSTPGVIRFHPKDLKYLDWLDSPNFYKPDLVFNADINWDTSFYETIETKWLEDAEMLAEENEKRKLT
jgi:hypothetical protein